jgi:hypothetical protein
MINLKQKPDTIVMILIMTDDSAGDFVGSDGSVDDLHMVVLCPKMKAPTITVITPHTVHTTLQTGRERDREIMEKEMGAIRDIHECLQ